MRKRIGFILDCDGTLMDTIGAWHESEQMILAEAGITLTKEQRDELNTLTLEEAGAFFHDNFGLRGGAEEVVQAILAYLLEFYRTRSEANPGALDFVKSAYEAGVPMAVLSSSPQSFLQAGMERGGFAPYIAHVVSVEDLQTTKRDVATYDYVCGLLGVSREAAWLFDADPDDIEVVVHRESIIHSMIEFTDNSILAQLGVPDMRIPIQYAITYPQRYPSLVPEIDWTKLSQMTFYTPDDKTFKCLAACKKAIKMGGLYPAVANGANEAANLMFRQHKIGFLDVGEIVTAAIENIKVESAKCLDDVLAADAKARAFAQDYIH